MGAFDDLIPNSQSSTSGAFDDLIPQAPKQNSGIVGDIGTALKRGVLQMPGMATGLADIAAAPVSIATGVNRPVSRAADWLGEQTGLQFGKWAEAAGAEYSPEMQQAQQNVEQAKGFFPTLGAVAQNPRVAAQVVAESLPATIAGGLVARGAMGAVAGAEKLAALRAAAGSADAAVANAARRELLKSGAIAAGVGEGAVTAGQQMAQTGYDVDPALAAGAALGAGVGTGIIGGLSGRFAGSALGRKLGLSDIETSMAAGTFGENAGKAGAAGYARRIGAGAIQEGLVEEAPQSYQEQVWQNRAAGKPLTEGAAEAAALGAVAGGVMGAGFNIANGPLSKAVAAAPGAAVPPAVPVPDAGIQPQDTLNAERISPEQGAAQTPAGIASAAQFPQFTAPPQPVTGGAPLEQAPTAMPVPQATQNAPAAPGSPSPVSAADTPLPAKQAEAAGAPIQPPQGPLPSADQAEIAIPPAQGPEAAALPVAAKPAKGIAAALQYPQQVTEGGGPLAQQAADMPLGRFGETVKKPEYSAGSSGKWVLRRPDSGRLIRDAISGNTRFFESEKEAQEYAKSIALNDKAATFSNRLPKAPRPEMAETAEKKPAISPDISPDIPAKKATRIASSSGIAGALVTPQQPTFGGAPSIDQVERGKVGGKVYPGQVLLTSSGRKTSPAPKMNFDTNRKASNSVRSINLWLLENAATEAEARGDDFNSRVFRQDLRSKKIPQASKDAAEEYLFGEQPEVQRPFTKPLVARAPDARPAEPVASRQTPPDVPQQPLSGAGEQQTAPPYKKATARSASHYRVRLKTPLGNFDVFVEKNKDSSIDDYKRDAKNAFAADSNMANLSGIAQISFDGNPEPVSDVSEMATVAKNAKWARIAKVEKAATQPQPKPRQQPQPAPIMRRDDLVGAIMRVTGGDGINSNMALTIAGDTAGRGLSKLRGLFTNRGTIDLGEVATRLREDEGFDVRDGEHLSELIRAASFGDTAVSMGRASRDQDTAEDKRHRDYIRQNAKKLKIKSVAVKFSDLEKQVIAALTRRHERAVELLDERAKKRFDAALEESYALLPEDVVDAVLVDLSGRGLSPREFWNQATETLRYMVADARAQKEQEELNAIEGAEPDWLKDDDGRGNQPAGGRGEADRVAEEARGEAGFSLAAQTTEEIAAAEAAAKEAKQAEAAAAAAEARKEKAAQDKAEKDRRAAEVLKEREAAKKAEVDKAAEEFALGQAAPEPVVKKVTTEEAKGQKDIFASPVEPKPSAKEAINDFGEKLEGARKDYAAQMKDAMSVDVAAEPLSKSWPEPDYQKLLDGGADPYMVAFVRSARDELPTKPQKSWKLAGWVKQAEMLRDMAQKLLSGNITVTRLKEILSEPRFGLVRESVGSRAELYELVGHKMSLKGVSFAQHFYSLYKGQENVRKWVVEQKAKATVFSNWPRELAVGDTKDEVLAAFKERIASLDLAAGAKRQPQFVIYRKRGESGAWVGKKIGREYIDLHKAADVAEARKYMAESLPALEAKLAKYKETPLERKADNQPRVGDDHRNGAPVTPEVFADTFGFRGVQFGNYVEQNRRQSDLNEAFDGLMDLAAVLGIPPRALSLNGQLGLAFGARGRGGKNAPAAHFETGRVVINLTKGGGPGSLAHEWWHSLDNYFAKQANKNSTEFVTAGARTDGVREAMRVAFNAVNMATSTKAYQARSAELDKRRSKPYWNTSEERSARAFEGYVIAKLFDQGAANDYLANVVDNEVWDITEDARAELFGEGKTPKTYPYPTVDEMPAVRAAFDEFFKTVETKESEDGNVALFSFAGQQSATADQFQLDRAKQLLADGANANAVRQQTGWFKNPSDGKWRYEIDDSGASLKAHGFGFGELLDALGKNLTLADVLDHPVLFAAYPSIAGSSVEAIDEKSQNNGELVTNKDGGFTIRVNAGLGEAKALSVMLHEIQHGIQNVEGFASGGNIDLMAGYDEPRIKAIENRISSLLGSGKQGKEIAPEINRLNARIAEIRKEDPYQAYRKLAGEVESRNVQQRQNFPADKRRLSDPLGTQDVAPEDVIVVFNGKEAKDAPTPFNTTRASAMAAVGASPADAAVFDMASEGKSAQEILAFLSKASRRPFNRVLAAALSRIGVSSTVSIDPAAGWRNNSGRNGAKFAASYSPKTDTVALYTPREAERHVLHELVHAATLKAIARGGPAARQMQAIFDYVQRTGTMSDQYGMGNFSRFPNETDAQFKKRMLDEFTAELFTNPQFQVRLKQLPAPSGSKLKSAWDWIVRVIANLLGLRTKAQETALDRALSVGAALLQENASLTMPKGETARYHTTWHGSPHKFYTFDLSKIGTGEGAQAYGHGLYVAEAPEVAKSYSGKLSSELKYNGRKVDRNSSRNSIDSAAWALYLAEGNKEAAKMSGLAKPELIDALDPTKLTPGGQVYKVDLPAEAVARMLDWDRPIGVQSDAVKTMADHPLIVRRYPDYSRKQRLSLDGQTIYSDIKLELHKDSAKPDGYAMDYLAGAPSQASRLLREAGIPGIKYLDQQSRSGEKATSNFVLFDDKLARIIEVNGVETGVQPWQPGEWEATQGGERFSQEQPFSGMEVAGFSSFEAIASKDGTINFYGTAKVSGQTYFAKIKLHPNGDGTFKTGLTDSSFETHTGKPVKGSANIKLEQLLDVAKESALSWANEYHREKITNETGSEKKAPDRQATTRGKATVPLVVGSGYSSEKTGGSDSSLLEVSATESSEAITKKPAQNPVLRNTSNVHGQVVGPFSGREVAATPLKPGTKTLMVDGVERPALNSNGNPIHWSEEWVRNFWRWFGDSKVVDEQGRPLVVYHGTAKDFTEFDLSRTGESTGNTGFYGAGAYFSQDGEDAGGYALWARMSEDDAANVISVYLALQNPLYLHINPKDDARRDRGRVSLNMIVDQLVSEGYFGKNPDKNEAGSLYARLTSFLEKADFERFMGTLYNELKGGEAVSDLARRAGFDGVMAEGFKKGENFLAEVVAFSPEQIKSAIGNTGAFSPEDPDIRYSLATNWQQSPVAPGNLYQAAKKKAASLLTPERLDKVIYETQDKFIDLRRIRDYIKEIGGTITDLNDAYLGEELYHKRLAYRTKQSLKEEQQPFFADMKARGVEMPEFEKFLHARHAPEANAEMARRNPNQKQVDAGRQKSAATVRALELNLQTAKARGLATVAIEKALTDARAELVRWNSAQAFKGTEAERLSLSGMSNADARALMAGLTPAQRSNMDALAAKVDAINEGTLQTLERYGLMDKTALNTWRNTYKHYVPLHRDEAHPDSVSHPIGQGFNVRGDASKRRTGSNQEVTNIFSHIAMQRDAALTRGEKNRVMQKLYLMARQNPIPEIWSVGKVPMIDTIDKATGFVRSVPDPQYKDKPNVITLRVAGKDVAIVMNEYNPQALRLAQSIKNLDVDDLHYLIPIVGKATRWFASINTQYNPIFGLINFARDVQTAALNLSTTEIAGKQKEVFKDTMSILGDIIKNKGRMPTAGKWAPIYKEFNEVGGTTGYRDLFLTAEDRSKAVTDEIKALDRGKVSQAAHAVAGWLSDYNEAMENATRLAAYKAAIDNGMSKERAASLAKNLTVNFNRKGRQTRELGALYAFFNAAVQGTARMAQTLSGPAGKKIMLGGVLAGAASAMAGIAAMGGGDGEDDEWSKIPEFVKERSFIIPAGKDKYIAIPMPLGFHFLPNIGRLMVEMAVYKDKTLGKQMASLFTVLADAFNPLGGSAPPMQIIAPTVMDPFIALAQNKDWTGKPIYVENFNSLNPQPGATRAKDSATPIAKGLADAINAVTGGTKYVPGGWSPTPDQIDYVIGQLTGGVGREIGKLSSTIAAPFTGDELPAHKIPLLGRLYGSTAGATGQAGKFYENIKRANEVENELKGRRKDGISVEDYLQDNPKAVELAARGNAAERQIRALRQMRSRIVEAGGVDAASKARQINERMATVMRGFNMQVERMQ